MLPSLVVHAVKYDTVIGAHNTIYVQMHVAGSTMFAWYGKRRRLQYYLCSDTPERLHRAREIVQPISFESRENVFYRGGSASPFIVEGDGLTSQRKRERVYMCAA